MTSKVVKQGKKTLKPVLQPVARQMQPLVNRAAGNSGSGAAKPKAKASNSAAKASAAAYVQIAKKISPAYSESPDGVKTAPSRQEQNRNLRIVRRLHAESRIARSLAAGRSLEESVIDSVRDLLAAGEVHRVTSMSYRLNDERTDDELGRYVLGMLLLNTASTHRAWSVFSLTQDPKLRAAAAAEYYSAAVSEIGADVKQILDQDIQNDHIRHWSDKAVLRIAQFAFTADLYEQTRQLIDHGLSRAEGEVSAEVADELRRLSLWLPNGPKRSLQSASGSARPFGVIGYDQPSARSRNVGDYIQTIASLGHLARQFDIEVTGDSDIVEFVEDARTNIKAERAITGNTGHLELFELERDANVYQNIPEGSWAVVFGWFMHETFGKRFNIPFHENLRPIMISVYVRHPEMLSTEAVAYMKKYGPVGCRDWQSVALLRAAGVPAFFSGCMTTTVDTLFPDPVPDNRQGAIRIDWRGGGSGPSRTQAYNEIRELSFAENLKLAKEWVSSYAYEYSHVLTSRLHAYLPARSVGAKVDFVPGNKSDWRFGGLIDIDDASYDAIRNGILDKLATVLPMIAAGAEESEIYDTWRDITAADMAHADEVLAAAALPEAEKDRVQAVLSQLDEVRTPDADVVSIFVDARPDEYAFIPKLIESIDQYTSTRFRILAWEPAFRELLAEGSIRNLKHGTVELIESAGNSRLSSDEVKALLPEYLTGEDRLIVVPAAARVTGDIAVLSAAEIPDGKMLAAKDDDRAARENGFSLLRAFARRLKDEHRKSLQFIFASHQRQFRPFSTDVMVLELGRARHEGLTAAVLGVMDEYGYNYEDAMQVVVNTAREPLSDDWNVKPQFELASAVDLVNWRGQTKPGVALYAPFADTSADE